MNKETLIKSVTEKLNSKSRLLLGQLCTDDDWTAKVMGCGKSTLEGLLASSLENFNKCTRDEQVEHIECVLNAIPNHLDTLTSKKNAINKARAFLSETTEECAGDTEDDSKIALLCVLRITKDDILAEPKDSEPSEGQPKEKEKAEEPRGPKEEESHEQSKKNDKKDKSFRAKDYNHDGEKRVDNDGQSSGKKTRNFTFKKDGKPRTESKKGNPKTGSKDGARKSNNEKPASSKAASNAIYELISATYANADIDKDKYVMLVSSNLLYEARSVKNLELNRLTKAWTDLELRLLADWIVSHIIDKDSSVIDTIKKNTKSLVKQYTKLAHIYNSKPTGVLVDKFVWKPVKIEYANGAAKIV